MMFGKFKNERKEEKQAAHGQQATDDAPDGHHYQCGQAAATNVVGTGCRCKWIAVAGTDGLVPPCSPRVGATLGFAPGTSFATPRGAPRIAATALTNGGVARTVGGVPSAAEKAGSLAAPGHLCGGGRETEAVVNQKKKFKRIQRPSEREVGRH